MSKNDGYLSYRDNTYLSYRQGTSHYHAPLRIKAGSQFMDYVYMFLSVLGFFFGFLVTYWGMKLLMLPWLREAWLTLCVALGGQ